MTAVNEVGPTGPPSETHPDHVPNDVCHWCTTAPAVLMAKNSARPSRLVAALSDAVMLPPMVDQLDHAVPEYDAVEADPDEVCTTTTT